MNGNENSFVSHNLSVKDRHHTELTGIDDILSFNEYEITLHSALGNLVIEGDELKLGDFSSEKGTLYINGKISGIIYLETDDKRHSSKKKAYK